MRRRIDEIEAGTEVKILDKTCGWGGVSKGDVGVILVGNPVEGVNIRFPKHPSWSIRRDVLEGEYFEVIERDFIRI